MAFLFSRRSPRKRAAGKKPSLVPQLEIPDNRTMPSTLTVLNALDPGGSPMQPRSSLKWIAAFAISLAMASWLAPSVQAGPIFDLHLVAPPFFTNEIDIVNSPMPLFQGIDGTEGMFLSGSAFGRAELGNLGAKATVASTAPPFLSIGGVSYAEVEFHDGFPLFIPGPGGFDFLRFTGSLHGTTIVVGDGDDSFVNLAFEADGATHDGALLTGPGTATLTIGVNVGSASFVTLDAFLAVQANIGGPEESAVIEDYSQSFTINAVQLFDAQGNFIRDVTLVDDAGNVLPVSAAAVSVSEPGTALLLAIATGVLGAIGLRSRRRIEAERRL
jgi:hypothetical protein